MSALSDVENLRLHDIADGDVRDDPRWLALMGEGALKAFLAEIAAKHLPGQHNQDSHGNDHGVDVIPGDKLRGAGRIDLAPGERLLRSDRMRGDNGRAWLAVTEKDGKRSLRIGLGNANFGTRSDGNGPWRAAQDRSYEINEEREELRARREELENEIEALEGDAGANPAAIAERRAQLEELENADVDEVFPNGHTAILDEQSAKRLRETLAKALDDGEAMQNGFDERDDRIDELEKRRNELRKIVERVFTDEEDAEWDRLTAEIEAIEAQEPPRPAQGFWTLAEGSIPGQWANVHYEVYLDDPTIGVETRLGAIPHHHDQDFDELVNDNAHAQFAMSEADEFVKLLAKMSGDLPKSSRRDTQNKHLPGRHDQSSHGRGGRRAATAVLDVPDVPKPEPVAEPKPPKPRRAPKPKPPPREEPAPAPRPEPKPPADSEYIARRRTILTNLLRNSDDPDVLRAAGQEWDEITGGEPRPRPDAVSQPAKPAVNAEAEAHVAKLVSQLPPALRPGATEGLMAQATYAPNLLMRFKTIGFDVDGKNRDLGGGFAQYLPGYGIQLNHRWKTQRAKLDKSYIAEQKAGYLTPSGTKTGLGAAVAHEFGHNVALKVIQPGSAGVKRAAYDKLMGALSSSLGISPPSVMANRPVVPHDTINTWLRRNSSAITRGLSGYSAESFHELLAEAWQEYTTRGPAARPAAKAVGKALAQLAGGTPR